MSVKPTLARAIQTLREWAEDDLALNDDKDTPLSAAIEVALAALGTPGSGFAAVDAAGVPLIRTVSETPTAAKVNYLMTECNLMVMAGTSGFAIDKAFDEYAPKAGCKIFPVAIINQRGAPK